MINQCLICYQYKISFVVNGPKKPLHVSIERPFLKPHEARLMTISRLFQPFSPRIIALIPLPPLSLSPPRHPRQTRSVPPRRQSDHQSALAAARGSRTLQEWAVRGRTRGRTDEPGETPARERRKECRRCRCRRRCCRQTKRT